MSLNSVTQQATHDETSIVAAAAALAQHTITIHGTDRREGETGERWLPLATLDALIVIDPSGVWCIIVYAPIKHGLSLMQTVAIIAGKHQGGGVSGAHLAPTEEHPGDPSRFAQAAQEIRAALTWPRQSEGQVAA